MEQKENYIVVTCYNSIVDFSKKVNEKISEGYTLVGGVSMSVYSLSLPNSEPSFRYAQAMLKIN